MEQPVIAAVLAHDEISVLVVESNTVYVVNLCAVREVETENGFDYQNVLPYAPPTILSTRMVCDEASPIVIFDIGMH